MKRKLLLIAMFLGLQYAVYAQTKNVTGIVTDAQIHTPLPGVSITVPGSTIGTVANAKGEFFLRVPDKISQVKITFLGYEEQLITLTGKPLVISLAANNKNLNEVVVVGYGSAKKKDLTGAITTISAQDIGGRRAVQPSDALEGQIAGVTVTRNGGSPGASSTITFRGITTIGNNAPLIIIDGVPSDNIDKINPDDIETITALKDAASTAIYGSRAAAGVLLVSTKRAKNGQASIDYNYEYGNSRPTALPTYVDAVRYLQLFNEYSTNDGGAAPYAQSYINNYLSNNASNPDQYPNVDWQSLILKKSAPREMHNVAFTTGTDKIKTRASIGYSSVDGLYDNRSYKKYNASVNNDFKINDKFSSTFDISLTKTNNNAVAGGNPIALARMEPGIYPAIYSNGSYAEGKTGNSPLAQIEKGGFDNLVNNTITGRASLNYKPIAGLTLTGLIAPTYVFTSEKIFSRQIVFYDPKDATHQIAISQPNTTLTESRPYSYSFNGQLLANYVRSFSDVHHIDVLLGYEDNYNYSETLTASRGSFTLTDFPYLDDGLLALRDNSGGASEFALRSYFGRVNYNYKNKYYIQANGRYDGSSRFSADHRWSFFPSFSAGWTISEENFFKDVKAITFLKLRGSWGRSGNQNTRNPDGTANYYPYQANIAFNNALFYNSGQVLSETSGAQSAYALQNISWETQQTTDIGLDASFLNNRLTISGDVYQKKTKDILLQLNVPLYIGLTAPFQNAGQVSAKGREFAVNWNDKIGTDWKYGIGFNISDAKTRIDNLKGIQQLGNNANIEGGEFNEWYGYKSAGLFQTAAEVSSSPVLSSAVKPGDIKYVDINGDGKITPTGDKVLLGGSLPRYTFGLNGRVSYKRFDFSFAAQGVGKVLSWVNTNTVEPFLSAFGNVPTLIDGKFWSPNNTASQNLAAKYPRLSRSSDAANYTLSDYWLINGQYLRIKNITLGYDMPVGVLTRIGLKSVRIYIAGNDLLTFSHFPKGADPEVDASSYPIVKTLIAGFNVKF